MKKNILIGVTGYLASGKDTVADYLVNKGYKHYSLSDELRCILKERKTLINRDNLRNVANNLRRKLGVDFLARRLLKKIKKPAIISSIRTVSEVSVFKKTGNFKLFFVDAPIELRYKRLKKRARENDEKLTFAKFLQQEKSEKSAKLNEQQLDQVAKMADYTIINDGSVDDLFKKIEAIMEKINAKKEN